METGKETKETSASAGLQFEYNWNLQVAMHAKYNTTKELCISDLYG